MSSTSDPFAARKHARAQAGRSATAMPTIPAALMTGPPSGVDPEALTWSETIDCGGYASKVLSRGTTLRMVDVDGDACAHLLLYNAEQPWERINPADTIKVPWQCYLSEGHPLLSDQGRVLATVVEDNSRRHDLLCGASSAGVNAARYGSGSAESDSPAVRELLCLAAAKHDLDRRDVAASIGFFKGVRVEPDGSLRYLGGAGPDRTVTLKTELSVVVLVANGPHVLDARTEYTGSLLQLTAWRGQPTNRTDALWSASPEQERAYLNTVDYANARAAS